MRLCEREAADAPAHQQARDGGEFAVRTFFYQRCPACGRSLRTPVQLLGQPVHCLHCQMQFLAQLQGGGGTAEPSSMERADRLLEHLAGRCTG